MIAVEKQGSEFLIVSREDRRFVASDGRQATVAMLRHAPETAPDFGVHFVDVNAPEGQRHTGAFADDDGVPVPVFEAIPPPASISAAQARIALLGAGLLSAVTDAVTNADEATQIWFEYATEWRRDNPILAALGASLGLTSEAIDDLFRQAAAIES